MSVTVLPSLLMLPGLTASATDGQADFLTVQEVADRLKVGRSTVYRLLSAGCLPAYRVGKQYRIAPDDLHRALREPIPTPRQRKRRG